jgi:hypothetical protein
MRCGSEARAEGREDNYKFEACPDTGGAQEDAERPWGRRLFGSQEAL